MLTHTQTERHADTYTQLYRHTRILTHTYTQRNKYIMIIIIYPLTARFVEAPQMLSSHLFLCLTSLLLPFTVLCKMVWPDLMNGTYVYATALCVFFFDGQEVFVWSNCLLDLGADFLVGNMVFV